jgi:hypothetical protein
MRRLSRKVEQDGGKGKRKRGRRKYPPEDFNLFTSLWLSEKENN